MKAGSQAHTAFKYDTEHIPTTKILYNNHTLSRWRISL